MFLHPSRLHVCAASLLCPPTICFFLRRTASVPPDYFFVSPTSTALTSPCFHTVPPYLFCFVLRVTVLHSVVFCFCDQRRCADFQCGVPHSTTTTLRSLALRHSDTGYRLSPPRHCDHFRCAVPFRFMRPNHATSAAGICLSPFRCGFFIPYVLRVRLPHQRLHTPSFELRRLRFSFPFRDVLPFASPFRFQHL